MNYRTRATLAGSALLAALFAVTALSSRPALACGGFFCSQSQPVNQAAERITFADNGDGTITAVIQILYPGASIARRAAASGAPPVRWGSGPTPSASSRLISAC